MRFWSENGVESLFEILKDYLWFSHILIWNQIDLSGFSVEKINTKFKLAEKFMQAARVTKLRNKYFKSDYVL